MHDVIYNKLLQLKKWSMTKCGSITYAGIMDIIENCTELCYLQLESMDGLTEADMNAIHEQLLQDGKKVDHRLKYEKYHNFRITQQRKQD
jgi:hypothetical protein